MPNLLTPLTVKGVTLRNRIVMPPMQSGRATFNGEVTNRTINFYVMRSAHIGLTIIEHAYITPAGKIGPKQLGIHNDNLILGLEKLTTAIHKLNTPVILQITHAGAVANKKTTGAQPVGPSATGKSRQLSTEELETITDEFAQATERAVKAGFDGVELHGAHGYLLNQFLSPLFNKRTDQYGGTLQNRIRFPLQVVEKASAQLNGKLLLYRLGATDLAPQGTTPQDATTFAQQLQQAGTDILDISGGMCGADPKQLRHQKAYFTPQAHTIKQATTTPIIGVGRITNPQQANQLIQHGIVDLVAIGRALQKDPNWAKKATQALTKTPFEHTK